jgi:ferredoxin--NADP+ reductase
MPAWLEGRVAHVRHWTPGLLSLGLDVDGLAFVAGQFARLGLPAPPGSREPMLGRPYSFVNAPHERPHEFCFVVVPGGPLSPRLAALEVGDPLWVADRPSGFFTVDEVPPADALWCIATGTGVGPFLSILRTPEPWARFGQVVLVHAARTAQELVYRDVIAGLAAAHAGAFHAVPVASREDVPGVLRGRIPALLEDGRLEARAGVPLTAEAAHAMLCGNPGMVDDVQAALARRGMRRHRRKVPGHVTVETYW